MLGVGVLALSSAAVLIRVADAPALSVAFYRLAFSALLLGGFAAPHGGAAWRLTDWPAVALAGTALALHFWAWMQSLALTSVASSTLLVTTTPVWIGLAARWLPGEARFSRRGWMGVGLAIAGGAVVALSAGTGRVTLAGVGLATVGAWLVAVYLLVGRHARQRMALAPYAAATAAVAAAVTGTLALATGAPLAGFDRTTWLALVALAAVPQGIGHGALLWAVRWTGAAVVSLVVLLEPIGAALLAGVFLDEVPGPMEGVGGALLLLGVATVVRARTDRFT